MFLFDDPTDYDPLEDIENRANPPATSVGKPMFIAAALGVGGFAFTGSAIVGGSLAAVPAYLLTKTLKRAWRNNVFLRRNPGCYAHLIKSDRDMVAWLEAYGRDDVAEQLQLALKAGQRLTPTAKRTAKLLLQPEALPPKNVAAYLAAEQPAITASAPAKSQPVPTATAQTATPAASQQTGQAQEETPILCREVVNLPVALAGRFKPTVITARPRVGKSLAISHAMAQLKAQGVSIWIIQPKPSPQELGYWKHADRFLGFWAEKCLQDDEATVAKLNQFIDEWRAQIHRPTLLFIDEGLMLEAKFPKWFKADFKAEIVVEGSSGETDRRVLWVATQSPLVTDLGLTTGKRSAFDMVTLQKADTLDHAHMVRSSYKSMPGLPDRTDFPLSPVGVLAYHSAAGSWVGVGQLPVPTIEPSDELCPELEQWARPSYTVVTSAPELEPSPIDDELPMLYQAVARMAVSQAQAEVDPAIELIESIADLGMREAMLISYRWARGRIDGGNPVDRAAFIERARKERTCQYLVDNRDVIWEDLQTLID
ncbi:MAG: hypothetical protein RLZZ511_1829 [Cyanobacteriota bacterium]|jgi:hypothetical protein